jgi:hypothetical protein
MKNLLIVVLAVLSAASTLSAQDTLKVRSYRVVDLCQNERRWLLAVDLGRILPSDSLVSFDITIGYDRTKLRPTDVLKEGTLSAAMSYEPFLNTAVTNEMRVAAGNIVKTVSGDVPLVAIAGDFLGSCFDVDTLGYPWPATFNSEFKKKYTVVRFDTVKATTIPRVHTNKGFAFADSALTISETDTSTTLTIVAVGLSELGGRHCIEVKGQVDLVDVAVQSVVGMKVDSVATLAGVTKLYVSSINSAAAVTLIAHWTGTKDLTRLARVSVKTTTDSDCACDVPALRDTITISKEYPNVSVPSFDEHSEIIKAKPDAIMIHCDHEEMKTVQFFDVLGALVFQESISNRTQYVSTSALPKGAYHIRVACGHNVHVTTILK